MSRQLSDEVIAGRAAISVNDPGTDVPEGWSRVLLTDIARLESGHTPSRKHPEWWGGDIPWVSLPDAREHHGGVILDTTQKTNELGLANSAARWLPKDTVCLSRTASVGYVFRLGRPMATSQDFVNWVCSDALEPRFLMHALLAEGKHLLNFGMGTTHTTIYFPAVLAFHINLAPLLEQRRIATHVEALLEQVKRAKERLDQVPLILKRFRQTVLAAACSGDLTKDWRQANPVRSADEVLQELGKSTGQARTRRGVPDDVSLPESLADYDPPAGWALRSVASLLRGGALVDVKDGNHGANHPKVAEFTEKGLPFITAAQVGRFSIDYETAYRISGEPLERIRVGFAKAGDAILTHKGSVGRTAVCDRDCVLTPQTTYYRPHPSVLTSRFLMYWFASPMFFGELAAVMSQTTRDFVPISEQYNLFLVVPPLDEQAEIVRQVDKLFALADTIERRVQAATARADRLPQAILSKAFSGELVPTEAALARAEGRTYESAEDLLKRVSASASTAGLGAKARRRGAKRSA